MTTKLLLGWWKDRVQSPTLGPIIDFPAYFTQTQTYKI